MSHSAIPFSHYDAMPAYEPSLDLPYERPAALDSCKSNVGGRERLISLAAGTAVAVFGLVKGQRGRLPLVALGVAIAGRGLTGRCQLYKRLGINTASPRTDRPRTAIPAKQGYKVEKAVTINRPAAELYAFWCDLANLPQVMRHLESVEILDDNRSRWTAVGPLGRPFTWDAEIFNDRANELIAWRSIPGGDVDTAGSIHFVPQSHDRGTEVKVSLKYDPPAGKLGAWIASVLGSDLESQIAEDLANFKRRMETGEVPTVAGQTSGRTHDSINV